MYGRGKKLSKRKTHKQSEENIINSITNLHILKKEKKEIKDRIIRHVRILFEQEDNDYHKPKRVINSWNNNNNNNIEYESNSGRNKNLSLE